MDNYKLFDPRCIPLRRFLYNFLITLEVVKPPCDDNIHPLRTLIFLASGYLDDLRIVFVGDTSQGIKDATDLFVKVWWNRWLGSNHALWSQVAEPH